MPKKIVTIAGSDTLAGGGLQADLATFHEYGLLAFTAITSIVTESCGNICIYPVAKSILCEQLTTIFSLTDIKGIKLGLLPSVEIIKIVSKLLQENPEMIVVVDPVLIFKEDVKVDITEIIAAMKELIFPFVDLITPNLLEAELFSKKKINTSLDMKEIAVKLSQYGSKNVVIKGGARILGKDAVDVFFDGNKIHILKLPKILQNTNNGAGCTFASVILAMMVKGVDILASIKQAKVFVYNGIFHGLWIDEKHGNVWQGAQRFFGSKKREK
ncbi:MAG: bifunctional hydroxymethylpyrimidine kinase/phosphomethylpyrimidine kinase [Streptococcaceae bacterium]|nr:bifunctional hydroxymethylpyrimidine kinase/phosphomethylpyrimidine kinase [Streptococcaceae bacterium]